MRLLLAAGAAVDLARQGSTALMVAAQAAPADVHELICYRNIRIHPYNQIYTYTV